MRATGSLTVLLLTTLMSAGCSWSSLGGGGLEQEPEEFPILWEKAGTYCSQRTPLRLVARSRAEMALSPVADVPVDFKREMVLAATMGRVMSDQYAIRIEHVWREGSMIKVAVRIHRPATTTQPSIQFACPYHVIVVPRSDLNVEDFSPDPRRALRTRRGNVFPGL